MLGTAMSCQRGVVGDPESTLNQDFASDSPGNYKESNWLPVPKDGDFSLYVRAYWPKAAMTDGSWMPPAVQPVN